MKFFSTNKAASFPPCPSNTPKIALSFPSKSRDEIWASSIFRRHPYIETEEYSKRPLNSDSTTFSLFGYAR